MGRCATQSLLNVLSEQGTPGLLQGAEKSILPPSIQMHESFHQTPESVSNIQKRGKEHIGAQVSRPFNHL
jgi:hypothetical protein